MARVYATPAELAEWLGLSEPPPDAARALRAASRLVDQALLTALYDTDDEGYPSNLDERTAVREATCAQAEHRRALGDTAGTGTPAQYAEVAIGSVQLKRNTAATSSASGTQRLSAEAWDILQQAGLTGGGPWST